MGKDIKELKPSKKSRFQQGYIDPRSCQKLFESVKNQRIIYRSSYERKLITWFENNKQIKRWGSECVRIPYLYIDEKMHSYYPDYVVERDTGEIIIIEVKPYNQTQKPKVENTWAWEQYTKNVCKWKATKEFCDRKGWKFMVFTERTIEKL